MLQDKKTNKICSCKCSLRAGAVHEGLQSFEDKGNRNTEYDLITKV